MMRALLLALLVCVLAASADAAVRIKDVTSLRGSHDYQLIGYGLVVGLQGTGDTLRNAPFTEQAIQSMLDHMGLNVRGGSLRNRNVAAVIVTADFPLGMDAGASRRHRLGARRRNFVAGRDVAAHAAHGNRRPDLR